MPDRGQPTLDALTRHLPRTAVHAGGADDPSIPGLWNEVGGPPLIRVECQGVADIAATVRIAADHGLQVAVWGGRHDVQARNAGADAVVVDLRRMRVVTVDLPRQKVTVQGGTTVGGLLEVLPTDRVTVTTANLAVGLVGAGVGGGYGPLVSRYGMICDQIVGAQVVLADGTLVEASPTTNQDMFWALRGGGSGFGVITEATFTTHSQAPVLNAAVFVPLSAATEALLRVQSFLDDEPDNLSILPLFTTGPDGTRGLFLTTHWTGPAQRGEQIVQALTGLVGATPVVKQWVPYAESFSPSDDALWPTGKYWHTDTRTIARIDESIAHYLVESVQAMPLPQCVLFLHDFHGAPTRVAPSSTAFLLRDAHFVVAMTGPSDPGDLTSARRVRAWVDQVAQGLAASALPGGYISFLPITARERVAEFYGDAATHLTNIKARFDPTHLFTGSTGMP